MMMMMMIGWMKIQKCELDSKPILCHIVWKILMS